MADVSIRGSMSYCGVFTAELLSELSVSHNNKEYRGLRAGVVGVGTCSLI